VSKDNDPKDPTGDAPVGDEWADEQWVRALRAPGDASELADEQRFVAAFAQTQGPPASVASIPRRVVRRLGAGGSAVIVVAALSGGVAAAFTGNLPDPVQQFAHEVLGAPAPEPAPAVDAKRRTAHSPSLRDRSAPATPAASPTVTPATASASPSGTPAPSPSPDASDSLPSTGTSGEPTGGSTAEPSDEPSTQPTPPAVAPSAVSVSGRSHLVEYGASLTLVGQLTTTSGDPVAGHRVALQVRDAAGWRRVTVLLSDAAGQATASTEPVTGLARYRWRAGNGVHSAVWRVRIKPTLAASYVSNPDTTTIDVACVGAKPGDQVLLYALVRRVPTLVGSANVGDAGGASFSVPTPPRRRAFAVRLEATHDHAPARTRLTVTPG
jgi:hypothetical protein